MEADDGSHMVKRVNFNMNAECHALLKGVSALKGKTLSEYVYEIITEEFYKLVREDKQVQSMFLAGTYQEGGSAYRLKELLIEELEES
tara:strand:- start:1042 stop:1305 length:264 start_codon:yes stop_codon:yes gene_type:complete